MRIRRRKAVIVIVIIDADAAGGSCAGVSGRTAVILRRTERKTRDQKQEQGGYRDSFSAVTHTHSIWSRSRDGALSD